MQAVGIVGVGGQAGEEALRSMAEAERPAAFRYAVEPVFQQDNRSRRRQRQRRQEEGERRPVSALTISQTHGSGLREGERCRERA